MIVVIGHPLATLSPGGARPGGAAAWAAIAAAAAGAAVELVGKIGDDEVGDAVVLALAAAGVGHVALLRDPSRATPSLVPGVETEDPDSGDDTIVDRIEPADPDARPILDAADVELGLRYLADYRAIVLADGLPDGVIRVAAEAARYCGAVLVGVTAEGDDAGLELPSGSFLLAGDMGAGDGAATLLGRVGAAIDRGEAPADALARELAAVGATPPG